MAFSPDSSQLATASYDGTARTWDSATGQPRATYAGHAGPVTAVAFSRDGSQLATASHDGTARTWETATGQPRTTYTGQPRTTDASPTDPVTAVAFSPDGTQLATAFPDGTAQTWDTATGECLATMLLGSEGYAVLLRDGSYKLDGDPRGVLWWAIKLCRFEAGELDDYVPEIRRLRPGDPLPGPVGSGRPN